jgi:Flp pilus assembly protein TadG
MFCRLTWNHRSGRRRPSPRSVFGDKKGVAAIEFAVIVPVLVLLYLGSVELVQGILLDRQVTLTTNTVANIVTQYTTISASTQIPDILNAAVQIFAPSPSTAATVVVSCITISSAGKAIVTWSQALNGTARATGQVVTVPVALDVPNTTLIFSETTYAYTPLIDFMRFGTLNLYAAIYMSPRASTTINLVA